jgi:hypothetical protein
MQEATSRSAEQTGVPFAQTDRALSLAVGVKSIILICTAESILVKREYAGFTHTVAQSVKAEAADQAQCGTRDRPRCEVPNIQTELAKGIKRVNDSTLGFILFEDWSFFGKPKAFAISYPYADLDALE